MQSSGLSSLIPKVTVYNGNLQGAVLATGSNYGDTVSVTISGVTPGQTWYIKAMAAASGAGEHRVVWPAGQLLLQPPGGHRAAFHGRGGSALPGSHHNPGGNGVDDWRSIHPLPGHLECYSSAFSLRRRWDLPHRLRHPLGLWRYDGGRQPGELWPPFPARARATRNPTRIISIVFPTPPDDSSETTIIPTAVHNGADPNQGGPEAMLPHRDEGPRPVEAARLTGRRCRARGLAVRQPAQEAPAVRRGTTLGERARPPAFPRS